MEAEYSKQAAKAISRMDTVTKRRIRKGIDDIPDGDIRPLKGSEDTFRLRIGDWRVLFSYPDVDKVLVEKISPRGEVYKGV